MKLSQVAQSTRGVLVGEDTTFEKVSTDTRAIAEGDLFVALRGENFDGYDFLGAAQAAGACAAVVERDTDVFSSYVRVADARRALGQLAAAWADQFPAPRVAVTGNAGKTTVKEMIAIMLGEQVHATRGNLNNDVGVPLTLLGLRAEHRFGVFELGANAPGEIAWTASLVRPEVALVTNVTGAHLEGFGSMQGIADAKAEIFSGMGPGSTAVINDGDSFAEYFAARAVANGARPVRVGMRAGLDLTAVDIEEETGGVGFRLRAGNKNLSVRVPLPGRHQVNNALLALAAVRALGVDLAVAVQRLASLQPVKGRMNVSACLGGTLVDDTYNANPGSVRAAVDWLQTQPAPRALVLGALAELGSESERIHAELGDYARKAKLEHLVAVGAAAPALQGFGAGQAVTDAVEAARVATGILRQGGTVLVKGSRSARMEAVIEAVRTMGETH